MIAALLAPQPASAQTSSSMQGDVDRLVRRAQMLTETWPLQPPPAIPEVEVVAVHGKDIVPFLIALLSDDPSVEYNRPRWNVQQQVALVLSRIYSESPHCGRIYCDGDLPERIARVKELWLRVIAADAELLALSTRQLIDRFKHEGVFWRQFEIGRVLAASRDSSIIDELEPWLTHENRHLRANAAFVIGRRPLCVAVRSQTRNARF